MKKLSMGVFSLILIFMLACTSQTGVPKNIKTSFEQKFPNAEEVKWDQENETEWEAEFTMHGKAYSANYSTDGSWMETEYEIEISDIPFAVMQTLDMEFIGFDIEEAEMYETAEGMAYEFTLEKAEENIEVAISLDGTILKQEVVSEEEEED